MNRSQSYKAAVALGFYLPPPEDKSLTLEKLRALLRFEVVSLPKSMAELVTIKVKHSKERLREAILQIYDDPLLLWFTTGRLPQKSYLVSCLYALDYQHPLFGKNPVIRTKRVFNINEKCKWCLRRQISEIRSIEYQKLVFQKPTARPAKVPMLEENLSLFEKVRRACRSRHRLVGLRRGIRGRRLEEMGLDDNALLAEIQESVACIDRLADKIINLPN